MEGNGANFMRFKRRNS